jgi:transcriptional regulator with XRE-family HTH domain
MSTAEGSSPLETKNPTLADQHVGRKLRWRRQELNLSQQELADRLGVTFQQIQKYERGANRVSAGRLFDLAQALETRIAYFYDGLDVVSAAAARRGAAEDAAEFTGQLDRESVDLLIAFQKIEDPEVRKSILASVKKQAKQAPTAKSRAKPKARSSRS